MISSNIATEPFVITVAAALLCLLYMLFIPAAWLVDLMEITEIPASFKFFILLISLGGFLCSWTCEKYVFLWVARYLGKIRDRVWPHHRKVRKEYKMLIDSMRT